MNFKNIKDYKLRKKAEELLKSRFDPIKYKSENIDDVIYDLHVHQIELDMQNEELREIQIKLENSQREYFDLYNFHLYDILY